MYAMVDEFGMIAWMAWWHDEPWPTCWLGWDVVKIPLCNHDTFLV